MSRPYQPRKRPYPPPQRTEWAVFEDPAHPVDPETLSGRFGEDYKVFTIGSLVGSLRRRKDLIPGRVKNIIVREAELDPIVFIGNTTVGKTMASRSLVYGLGGSACEFQNEQGRTIQEANVIFGTYTQSGEQVLYGIKMHTHSGHDLERSIKEGKFFHTTKSITTLRDFGAVIAVLNPFEDMTYQIEEIIVPLLDEWNIKNSLERIVKKGDHYHLAALFSHCDEHQDLIPDEIYNKLTDLGIAHFYHADNRTLEPQRLSAFQEGTVKAVVDSLRLNLNAPDFRLIYFAGGDREIPWEMRDYVAHIGDTPYRFRPAEDYDQKLVRSAMHRVNLQKPESKKW